MMGRRQLRAFVLLGACSSILLARCVGDDSTTKDAGPDSTADAAPDVGSDVITGGDADADAGNPCVTSDAGGTLDQTFNTGSKNLNGFNANGATIDAQGRIYVVGFKPTGCAFPNSGSVYRFNSDGSLDNTYGGADAGGAGFACFHYDSVDSAYAAAIDSDGKLVVGSVSFDGNKYVHATVTRVNTDGTLDKTFNTTGKLDLDPKPADAGARRGFGAVQGIAFFGKKIVVTGSTDAVQVCQSCSGGTFTGSIARLTQDGQFDTGFAGTGFYKDTTVDGYYSVHVDGAGTITTIGSTNVPPKMTLVRQLDVSGNATAFGDAGTFGMPLGGNFGDDGRDLLFSGTRIFGASSVDFLNGYQGQFGRIGVFALTAQGALDTTWGGDDSGAPSGVFGSKPDFTMNEYYQITSLATECDGKLLTGGTFLDPDAGLAQDLAVRRLTSDGHLDTAFGTGGLARFSQVGNEVTVAVAQDPTTSRIVVVGRDGSGNTVLARFLP